MWVRVRRDRWRRISFGTLDKIAAAGADELQTVRDVGDVLAESVVTWFGSEENQRLVERLRASGVNMTAQQQPAAAGGADFTGKIFVLTGTLTEPRDVVADRIRAAGGKVASSVSKKTSYVVAGEHAGSKLEDAQRLGVTVLTEAELAELAKA